MLPRTRIEQRESAVERLPLRSGVHRQHGEFDGQWRTPGIETRRPVWSTGRRDLSRPPRHDTQAALAIGTCAFRNRRTRSIVRAFNSAGSFQGNTVTSAFGHSDATSTDAW